RVRCPQKGASPRRVSRAAREGRADRRQGRGGDLQIAHRLAARPASPAATARPSTFAALKSRNYCLYWSGLVFYVLGHRAAYVTFAGMTFELAHDPLHLGYLGLAQGTPLVVFQLLAGALPHP